MPLPVWLLMGFAFWFVGVRGAYNKIDKDDSTFIHKRIKPIKAIRILSGLMLPDTHKVGSLNAGALASRFIGMFIILCGLFFYERWPVQNADLSFIIGMACSVYLSLIVTYLIVKKFAEDAD